MSDQYFISKGNGGVLSSIGSSAFNIGELRPFIIEINSGATGTFKLPIVTPTPTYKVRTSDGQKLYNVTDAPTITFPATDTNYTIEIYSRSVTINAYSTLSTDQKNQVLFIRQWGDVVFANMSSIFRDCTNLDVTATDVPDLTQCTSLSSAFNNCSSLTTIGNANWDTSNITHLIGMFLRCSVFNQDLNTWDTSNVTDGRQIFYLATAFNGKVGNWDVSKFFSMDLLFRSSSFNQDISGWRPTSCGSFGTMFRDTPYNQPMADWEFKSDGTPISFAGFLQDCPFNQDISGWDTQYVNNMSTLFRNNQEFNQDISGWETGNVTDMYQTFIGCAAFNQDISSWDTSKVTDMAWMFRGASSFNYDISAWDVSKVTTMLRMFQAKNYDHDLSDWVITSVEVLDAFANGFSTANYDAILISWGAQNVKSNVVANFGSSTYTRGGAAEAARDILIGKGWVITDN